MEVLTATSIPDIDMAFEALVQKQVDALLVNPNILFGNRRVQLVTLATRYAMPAMYPDRQYTEVGGLMSYGTRILDQYRQLGIYTARVLGGEKPADLPVMQPTKFEFVINFQTVKTLGLAVPTTLRALADEVIEWRGASSSRCLAARRPRGRSRRARSRWRRSGGSGGSGLDVQRAFRRN